MEFFVFLPQMRMNPETLVERAQAAEEAGFAGITLMDHLTPPLAPGHTMFEAFVTATWLAANTRTLKLGHLVLCDGFRSPALLSRQAVSLDHMSGGRFELGIGSGSTPEELVRFGLPAPATAGERIARLGETLEVLRRLWTGEVVTYHGSYHQLDRVSQLPPPLSKIPIVIGGTGQRTMELVAEYADWWNVPGHQLDQLEPKRKLAGCARVSVQELVTLVPDDDHGDVVELARRRFGQYTWPRGAVGPTAEIIEHFHQLAGRGAERAYIWFTDFAVPSTLGRFSEVIAALSA